jgi:hypothetical protein
MPTAVAPKTSLAFGAGWLYYSDPGVAIPTNTVTGNKFVVAVGGSWFLWGVTREGHVLGVDINTDGVEAAEYLENIINVTTSRDITVEADFMQVSGTMLKRVFNGGTLTSSGSAGTGDLLTTYRLPQIGAETRQQLFWESTDSTERWYAGQVFNGGTVNINRRKGADNASLPVTFTLEPDVNGDPFVWYGAGPTRA